jgi:repressor LexA
MNLTPKQKEVLVFVTNFQIDHPYPPTLREIAESFGISPASVIERLNGLEKKGYIIRDRRMSRGIWITEKVEELQNG